MAPEDISLLDQVASELLPLYPPPPPLIHSYPLGPRVVYLPVHEALTHMHTIRMYIQIARQFRSLSVTRRVCAPPIILPLDCNGRGKGGGQGFSVGGGAQHNSIY